jgi:hypothetical protein
MKIAQEGILISGILWTFFSDVFVIISVDYTKQLCQLRLGYLRYLSWPNFNVELSGCDEGII